MQPLVSYPDPSHHVFAAGIILIFFRSSSKGTETSPLFAHGWGCSFLLLLLALYRNNFSSHDVRFLNTETQTFLIQKKFEAVSVKLKSSNSCSKFEWRAVRSHFSPKSLSHSGSHTSSTLFQGFALSLFFYLFILLNPSTICLLLNSFS